MIASKKLYIAYRVDGSGICHSDRQRCVLLHHRHDVIPARIVGRDDLDDAIFYLKRFQIDKRDVELSGEGLKDLFLSQDAHTDEDLAQFAAKLSLHLERFIQLALGDQGHPNKQFSEKWT